MQFLADSNGAEMVPFVAGAPWVMVVIK